MKKKSKMLTSEHCLKVQIDFKMKFDLVIFCLH